MKGNKATQTKFKTNQLTDIGGTQCYNIKQQKENLKAQKNEWSRNKMNNQSRMTNIHLVMKKSPFLPKQHSEQLLKIELVHPASTISMIG